VRRRGRAEDGQITLLSIGFVLVALALVLVVASASSVHIERKRLLALADAAAADAADAVAAGEYYGGAGGPGAPGVPLSDDSVLAAVNEHLVASPLADRFAGLAVGAPTGTPDGRRAEVTLTATAQPPLVPWVLVPWSDGIGLRVTVSARAD
jgi:hypothetical protein